MRIVSLLPSATEILCALGARDDLVGRSHECDYPPGVDALPVLTSARVGPLLTSRAIDAAVRDVLKDALAIYEIDIEKLREVRPDVIVTQDLCDVCAVSLDDVRAAVARLARSDVRIVNLHPTVLEDIWADIGRIADAIARGTPPLGPGPQKTNLGAREVVADLKRRVARIAERAEATAKKPTVLSIEWIDPVMIGGMWMPELITLAGGTPLMTKPGDHAPTLTFEELEALDPDVVIVKPCGFDLWRTTKELPALRERLPWGSWRAVAESRVFIADGNAFFNRPGPRMVESLEILAACVHPEVFGDFAEKHRESVVFVRPDLTVGVTVLGGVLGSDRA